MPHPIVDACSCRIRRHDRIEHRDCERALPDAARCRCWRGRQRRETARAARRIGTAADPLPGGGWCLRVTDRARHTRARVGASHRGGPAPARAARRQRECRFGAGERDTWRTWNCARPPSCGLPRGTIGRRSPRWPSRRRPSHTGKRRAPARCGPGRSATGRTALAGAKRKPQGHTTHHPTGRGDPQAPAREAACARRRLRNRVRKPRLPEMHQDVGQLGEPVGGRRWAGFAFIDLRHHGDRGFPLALGDGERLIRGSLAHRRRDG